MGKNRNFQLKSFDLSSLQCERIFDSLNFTCLTALELFLINLIRLSIISCFYMLNILSIAVTFLFWKFYGKDFTFRKKGGVMISL